MKQRKKIELFEFILFTSPGIILILLYSGIPFFMNVYYAFTDWTGLGSSYSFVGFQNFIEIFTDDRGIRQAANFTFRYVIWTVVFTNLFAFIVALIVDNNIKGRNILKAGFYLPSVLSMIIVGFMWRFIFSMGFESFYQMTGFEFLRYSWLGQPNLVFFSVTAVSVWRSMGFHMIIYLAGLQAIPQDVLEASTIDGIGRFQKILFIIIPLVFPSITVSVFMSMINSLKVFDLTFSLTGGGPGNLTMSISHNIYREAFIYNFYGYGTAKSFLFFIIVLFITAIQLKYFKEREVDL